MAKIEFDLSEVRALAADMSQVDSRLARHVVPVVKKGAVNIKKTMQSDLRGSSDPGFRYVARTVNYDIDVVDGSISAEIGPDKSLGGALANIAYFGSWKGGGTVRDPREALAEEESEYVRQLEKLAEELVF